MATYQELQQKQQAQKIFEELKADGFKLLQEGKIDELTYNTKVRDAGVELGLIGPNEYPGRLPGFVEPALEIAGGISGAIAGIPGGLPGIAAGAGIGAGGGSLLTDFIGDVVSPNMPSPSAGQRTKDALLTGTIDAGLTAAAPGAGKLLSSTIREGISGSKNIISKGANKLAGAVPSTSQRVGFAEKALGITDDAAKKAELLGKEGIELSLGQASSSPFVRGAYDLSNRMPLAGKPGQAQLKNVFEQVNKALDKRISPSAKLRPLTESERSDLIKEVGLENFNTWRKSYSTVYKKADSINKGKGAFFDMTPLANTANRVTSPSKFTDAPKEIVDLLDELKINKGNKIKFVDVKALDTRLTDLSKKYDPAKSDVPNNYAFRTSNALLDTMKKQLRNPSDEAGRLYLAGDKMFKNFMQKVENKTGKEFQKALGRGALRPGIGRPPTARIEDLYSKTFGQNKSPEAVRELRALVGDKQINDLAANYLDDIFGKYIKSDKRDFTKLFDELGLSNPQSMQYEATRELLKTYKHTNIDDLSNLLGALKEFPEVLPEVNQFIQRSGMLRAANSLGPSAMVGMTGASTSGGVGAFAGLGMMYGLNRFLSKPFNKELIKKANTGNKEAQKEFLRKFLQFLPQSLPSGLPASAVAVQPLVPLVEDQIVNQ
tara:strand:+ start:1258 stop:3237 length:1980 start_codon:yes stop_codon:yes gene_type:complete